MAKSSIFEGFTSPAKGQPKKAVMKRYGRRQLLKEKAGKAFIQKNPNGAEIGEEAEAEEEEEEEMNEGEEADAEIRSTGTDANSEDVDNTSALQALADQFAVGAADDGSDIEETSEGSTMGQTTGDASLSGLVESSNDDEDTKKSESLTTPEEDMYYIEAVKSSRIGNGGKLEFLIKWEGYEKKSDLTWEPEKTLVESASEILSEYFEKIGGRDTIGAKRKRGRPSKMTSTDSSENLPNAKKQKLESEPVLEKVKIIWNEGEGPNSKTAKDDHNSTGEGDGREIIPKMSPPKKGRGRPPKSNDLENSKEVNDTFKKAPGIVSAQVEPESSRLVQASKPKNKEPMSEIEQEKMENLKGFKTQSNRQSFTSVNEPGEHTVTDSSNDVAKKSRGRPPKAQGNVALSADQVPSGKDTAKKRPGRPPKSAGQLSSQGKPTNLEESSAKKGRGRPQSTGSDMAQTDEGLAASAAKKPRGRPLKNGGSTPSSGAKNILEGSAVKRGRGRPSKVKEPRNIGTDGEEDHDKRESSALG